MKIIILTARWHNVQAVSGNVSIAGVVWIRIFHSSNIRRYAPSAARCGLTCSWSLMTNGVDTLNQPSATRCFAAVASIRSRRGSMKKRSHQSKRNQSRSDLTRTGTIDRRHVAAGHCTRKQAMRVNGLPLILAKGSSSGWTVVQVRRRAIIAGFFQNRINGLLIKGVCRCRRNYSH